MGLVPSASPLRKNSDPIADSLVHRVVRYFTLLGCTSFLSFGISPLALAQKDFGDFASLRHELLNLIASANKRVWVVSDFLSDGEIVSGLYVAKYRRIDVGVLLGATKVNNYMSRYSNLQKQSIPVALRPKTFPFSDPSLLLVDQRLYKIDAELNFLANTPSYRLTTGDSAEVNTFVAAYLQSQAKAAPVRTLNVPSETQKGHNREVGTISEATRPEMKPQPLPITASTAFNYDHVARSDSGAAGGVARSLPRQPLYMKNHRNATESAQSVFSVREDQVLNPSFLKQPIIRNPHSPESY